jgi:HK97 family phage portal protein
MANLFQNLFSKLTGGLWQRMGGQGWTRLRLLAPGSRFDYEADAGDFWSNPVVGLCIDWLGNRYPRPRFHVSRIKRNGDFEPMGRHPLADLWERPNPYYTRRTMEKAIGLSLKVDGNAYLHKVRDRGGRVVQLWWLPHFRVMPTWPSDGSAYIDGYKVRLDSAIYTLPPEDVLHIRDGIDPRNDRLGLCALRACVREVCTVNEESGYRAAILRNSGVPGLVIVPDSDQLRPNQMDADTIRDRFREMTTGDARGNTVVLGGKYRVEVIGFSPEQLNLIDFPVIPTARILSSMGVAPMSVGLPDPGKTYANLGEANRTSWGGIVSTQELVAESVRFGLLPEFGADPMQYCCEYDYTHIQELQESLDAVHARTREDWKAGVVQLNEARETLGYEPDPDGDRWYPGTGSPEEIERQAEQQQARADAMAKLPAPAPNGNGKPEEKGMWHR